MKNKFSIPYPPLPPDLYPKEIKKYHITPTGVVTAKPGDIKEDYLKRILRNSDILVAEKLITKGIIGRNVTVGTTPTLLIRSKFLRNYIILNPSTSIGLTTTGALLTSATRSGTGTSSALGVANYRDVHLFLNITAITGTGSTVIDVQALDPVTGTAWAEAQSNIFGSPSAVGTYYANIGSLGVATDLRVEYTVNSTDATFSLGYVLKDGLGGTGSGISRTVYLGGPGVTTVSGFPLLEGQSYSWFLEENAELWGIASSSLDIRIFELQ